MKKTKFWILIPVCLILAMAATGCATVPDVVATVNGVKISGEEFTDTMNGFLSSYGLTGETLADSLGAEEAVEYKNSVIDELILQELMIQYAQQNGLDVLSDEEQKAMEESADTYLSGLKESFRAEAQTQAESDASIDVESETEQQYNDYVNLYGYTRENLIAQYSRQQILSKVYDDVMADCQIAQEDMDAYYKELLTAQQELDETDPDTAFSNYINGTDAVAVYVPQQAAEQVKYVKHIFLKLPQETQDEIDSLTAEGKTEEADALQQEAMASLKKKAEEILVKAQAGEDFDALITEYNEDPGMDYYPEGYMVYEGASYDEGFLTGALALEQVGDISQEPVESSTGYHIIQYVSSPVAGAISYEDVQEQIESAVQSTKQSEFWMETVQNWEDAATISRHTFRSNIENG